jgi:hypothetical protein
MHCMQASNPLVPGSCVNGRQQVCTQASAMPAHSGCVETPACACIELSTTVLHPIDLLTTLFLCVAKELSPRSPAASRCITSMFILLNSHCPCEGGWLHTQGLGGLLLKLSRTLLPQHTLCSCPVVRVTPGSGPSRGNPECSDFLSVSGSVVTSVCVCVWGGGQWQGASSWLSHEEESCR